MRAWRWSPYEWVRLAFASHLGLLKGAMRELASPVCPSAIWGHSKKMQPMNWGTGSHQTLNLLVPYLGLCSLCYWEIILVVCKLSSLWYFVVAAWTDQDNLLPNDGGNVGTEVKDVVRSSNFSIKAQNTDVSEKISNV